MSGKKEKRTPDTRVRGATGLLGKYSFLLRNTGSILAIIIALTATVTFFIFRNAYHELLNKNREVLVEQSLAVHNDYLDTLDNLRQHSRFVTISTMSSPAFRLNELRAGPHKYIKAIEELNKQIASLKRGIHVSLYFPQIDAVFGTESKTTLAEYLLFRPELSPGRIARSFGIAQGIDATETSLTSDSDDFELLAATTQLREMFLRNSTPHLNQRPFLVPAKPNKKDVLLYYFVPNTIYDGHQVIVIYTIRQSALLTRIRPLNYQNDITYALYDHLGTMIWQDADFPHFDYQPSAPSVRTDLAPRIVSTAANIVSIRNDLRYNGNRITEITFSPGGLTLLYAVPDGAAESGYSAFLQSISRDAIIIAVVFSLVALSIAVLNHLPLLKVQELAHKKLIEDDPASEAVFAPGLSQINLALNTLDRNLTSSKDILDSLVIWNLIFGVPMTTTLRGNLKEEDWQSEAFVVLTTNLITDKQGVIASLEESSGWNCLLLELSGENISILVCYGIIRPDRRILPQRIRPILGRHMQGSDSSSIISIGPIVSSLADIRHSYTAACFDLHASMGVSSPFNKVNAITPMASTDKNFIRSRTETFIAAVCAGDTIKAKNDLNILFVMLSNEEITPAERNLFNYNILIEYLDALKRIDIPLSGKNRIQLISFADQEQFEQRLLNSVDSISQAIARHNTGDADVENADAAAVLKYLHTHFSEPDLSRGQVADELHISVSTLTRMMMRYTNMSFSEYINTLRINKAKELLSQTDLGIGEIADQCGYAYHSYFSRTFKLFNNNESPSEYRQRFRDSQDSEQDIDDK